MSMTPKELAKLADVSPNMIYTYMRTNRLAYVTITDSKGNNKVVFETAYAIEWATQHVARRKRLRENRLALIESQLGRRVK